jgi:hypothetical protein
MNGNHSVNDSPLDRAWRDNGIGQCKNIFYEAYKKNPQNAAALLNDQHLTFSCLFILMPQIKLLRLHSLLNLQNTTAIKIVNRILRYEEAPDRNNNFTFWGNNAQPVLKWIIETGGLEDGLEDEDRDDYEEVLDICASVLINVYKDVSILPVVTDMLFHRYKRGGNIHTLVWSVFSIHEPAVLSLIAEHLRSPDKREAELACNLLNFKTEENRDLSAECQEKYEAYLQWIEENHLFLSFTDESLQFASNPVFCKVDLDRKYVHKANSSHMGQVAAISESMEEKCLQAFAPLSREEKTELADYSYKMYNQDVSQWGEWIQLPVDEQLKTNKTGLEGEK